MRGLVRRAVAEAIGTFFLVLVGTGAVMVDARTRGGLGPAGVGLAFGAALTAMVYALGHVSGAHLNPAVTVALWHAGRFPRREVSRYLAAQCAGAVAASLALRALLGPVGGLGAAVPTLGIPRSFGVELLLSFVLMLVVVSVTTDRRAVRGHAAIAVGVALGLGVLVGGPLSGGALNPARALGPAVAGGTWTAHWIYWAAPVLGMVAAVRVYAFLRPAGTFQDGAVGPGAERPVAAGADAAGPAREWSVHDGMVVPLHGWRSGHAEGREDGDA